MAWPDDGNFASWGKRVKITHDALAETPPYWVLRGSDLPLGVWDHIDSGSADVRLARADGETEVAQHCVSINTVGEVACWCIKGDQDMTSATEWYFYYDNIAATLPAVGSTYGRNAVFAGYSAVYLPGMTLDDLTGNGYNLTAVGTPGTAAGDVEGITAATYNGSSQYHWHNASPMTDYPMEISAIYKKPSGSETAQAVFGLSNNSTTFNSFRIARQSSNNRVYAYLYDNAGTNATRFSGGFTTYDVFEYAFNNRDAATGTTRLYHNGVQSGGDTTTVSTITLNKIGVGALKTNTSALTFFNGNVSYATISGAVSSANHIATMHDIWTAPDLYEVSAVEAPSPGTPGTTGWSPLLLATSTGGGYVWTNPTQALGNTSNSARVVEFGDGEFTQDLALRSPDFSADPIPLGATITALHFRIENRYNDVNEGPSSGGGLDGVHCRAVRGGSVVGTTFGFDWSKTKGTDDAGGDLIGTTWVPSDFGSTTGFNVKAEGDGTGPEHTFAADVYQAWIKVDYTYTPALSGSNFFLMFV